MMEPWLAIVGIGEDGLDGLSPAGRSLLATAQVVIGGARHLSLIGETDATRLEWPQPFNGARELLEGLRGRKVVVLASGDPMWFGVGATLVRWFDPAEMTVVAHPGAFSLAAARLGWPLQDCLCLSIHGRPIEALSLNFQPGRRLLILGEDGNSPTAIAELLEQWGFASSPITILERLGGPRERVHHDISEPCDPLAVIAVELAADYGASVLSTCPGLPDEAFLNDGQLTKREIRAVTLASLSPLPGRLLWDVGAGCGSVAIEWMRAGGRAVALEKNHERCDRIARNAAALGVPELVIRHTAAPDGFPSGHPDAIFIGGGLSKPGMLDDAWDVLADGGRLVANAVTAEGEAALLAFQAERGGTLSRLSVARLAPVGGFHAWQPAMPVTQYVGHKR